MAILVKHKLQSDLEFLQAAKTLNFQTISTEKIEELVKNKIEYKEQITTSEERDLYSSLKVQLHSLCKQKLPYRIVEIIKKCLKQNQHFPSSLFDALRTSNMAISTQFSSKQERKEALGQLKQKLLSLGISHEEALQIVEPIHWIHGTNSAILPMLAFSDYTMTSTGELLDNGLAPMCGELTRGGMVTNGVNQQWLSVETVRNLSRAWTYAAQTSNSFDPKKFDEAESLFINTLAMLQRLSPDESSWDGCIITLLQLKQWNPKLFEKLQKKYAKKIEETIQAPTKKLFHREAIILEALQYPEEELKKAIHDERTRKIIENKFPFFDEFVLPLWSYFSYDNPYYYFLENAKYTDYAIIRGGEWKYIIYYIIKLRLFGNEILSELQNSTKATHKLILKDLTEFGNPPEVNLFLQKQVKEKVENRIKAKSFSSAKRLLRLKNIFEKKLNIEIAEEDKPLIISPFPLLVGSTKTKCFFLNGDSEANITSAKWGDEIDIVFVRDENLQEMTNWLEKQGLKNKVQLHNIATISPLFSIPLYHTASDVIGENHALSGQDYDFIHQQVQSLLPLYQKPYPDGSLREYHGVAHATRAAFFSAVITEMYLAQGYLLTAEPKNLPITGFMHDAGRESDYGEDLWDAQSGEICRKFMTNHSPKEAQLLSRSISEKDANPSISLEQRIIHDADCIEIIRCFLSTPDAFDRNKLWMLKDQFPEPLVDLFINEAKSLIILTEKPLIKKFMQTSPDPLRCLMQIIQFANCFSFLKANALNAFNSLCLPSDYLLTPEIENAINAYLKEKK